MKLSSGIFCFIFEFGDIHNRHLWQFLHNTQHVFIFNISSELSNVDVFLLLSIQLEILSLIFVIKNLSLLVCNCKIIVLWCGFKFVFLFLSANRIVTLSAYCDHFIVISCYQFMSVILDKVNMAFCYLHLRR